MAVYERENLTMPLNFNELYKKLGEVGAWHCLAEIERAAGLKPQYENADPEARLARALRTQDALAILKKNIEEAVQNNRKNANPEKRRNA